MTWIHYSIKLPVIFAVLPHPSLTLYGLSHVQDLGSAEALKQYDYFSIL